MSKKSSHCVHALFVQRNCRRSGSLSFGSLSGSGFFTVGILSRVMALSRRLVFPV